MVCAVVEAGAQEKDLYNEIAIPRKNCKHNEKKNCVHNSNLNSTRQKKRCGEAEANKWIGHSVFLLLSCEIINCISDFYLRLVIRESESFECTFVGTKHMQILPFQRFRVKTIFNSVEFCVVFDKIFWCLNETHLTLISI